MMFRTVSQSLLNERELTEFPFERNRNNSLSPTSISSTLNQDSSPRRQSSTSSVRLPPSSQPGIPLDSPRTPAEVVSYHRSKDRKEQTDEPRYLVPLATNKTFQNFNYVVERQFNRAVQKSWKEKEQRVKESRRDREKYGEVLQRFRNWGQEQDFKRSLPLSSIWKLYRSAKCPLPSKQDLVDMVRFYYPPRAEVMVYICDFGRKRFEKNMIRLGDIHDSHFHRKPPWADVRWIHAPLNVGLVQSSLEERFLRLSRDTSTALGRNISWPYAQVETLSLRMHDDLKDMQDAYQLFAKHSLNRDLANLQIEDKLNKEALDGMRDDLRDDMEWRAEHWGLELTHWNLALPDFQRQMNSSAEFIDPDYLDHTKVKVERQALASNRFFKKSQLIRSNFRSFHRSDGFLLTLCADGGIDYIDKDLDDRINKPGYTSLEDEEGTVIGLMTELFSETGSETWQKRSVDWFLVYLLTEIVAKPNNIRQGCNAPNLTKAYQSVVQDLKDKRYAEFVRKESVKLVREYLACIDELTTMSNIWDRSQALLEHLGKQAEEIDNDHQHDGDPSGDSCADRVIWAAKLVQDNRITTTDLLSDLQMSLTALFQLRSIEQNELAIVADNQNKAILIFTGFTIVFLPLSFFTSYFGMNLQGIASTNKSESYFWTICGAIGFPMILVVTLYVMRQKMARRLRRVMLRALPG